METLIKWTQADDLFIETELKAGRLKIKEITLIVVLHKLYPSMDYNRLLTVYNATDTHVQAIFRNLV